jgi:hypothetical protein
MANLSILKNVAAAAALSVVAITTATEKASAITLTFNLGGFTQLNPTYSVGGFTLTPTASATPNNIPLTTNVVTSTTPVRTSNGLGIRTATRTTANVFGVPVSVDVGDTTDQIDGLGAFETLTLSFPQAVRLLSVSFASVGSGGTLLNDDFTFIRNGTVVSTQDVPGGNVFDTGTGTFNIPVASQIGNSFGFRASQLNDDFFVSSVTVEVPEPITMAGIAMGAGFGVILRRKYKKSTNASESMSS